MKDNLYSWFSGFTLTRISMINGWLQVKTAVEGAVYGLTGRVVDMFGKWLVQNLLSKYK